MQILTTAGWKEYTLLDSGNSLRLEKFGPYTVVRPDPQAIWQPTEPRKTWESADVLFTRTSADSGKWHFQKKLPEKWLMHWKNLSFWTRLTSFKHTGVFPEQSLQWDFIQEKIKQGMARVGKYGLDEGALPTLRQGQDPDGIKILNLFGYTGIATLAAASAGAKVTHVDASKPSITWARENAEASGLSDKPIRWILDDVQNFVEKEIRRGNTYDGIILDPPVYGHGPTGQIWKFNEDFPHLMTQLTQLLPDKPLFIVVNAYAISSSALMLQNVLGDTMRKFGGDITVGELVLEEKTSHRPLSTGIFGRWHL